MTGISPCIASDMDPSTCTGNGGSCYQLGIPQGKKYLLRIVNTSAARHFSIAIDNHMLEVIRPDSAPIEPYQTEEYTSPLVLLPVLFGRLLRR
jgi:hypothetical protein